MRLKVEMTLNANTAQRFRETAERLSAMDLGDDGMLAAVILMRIATGYDAAVVKAKMAQIVGKPELTAPQTEPEPLSR